MRERNHRVPPRRSAFTIIEILIVIGIIALLVALTAGTIMQVINSQQKGNTEKVVRNVAEPLDGHIRAVLDQANELPIPASVLAIAGQDQRRAKVIWRKLQLKRNFPTTYAEALMPWYYTGNTAMPATNPLSATDLPALEVFTKNLPPLVPPLPAVITVTPQEAQAEMGALLRLTLTVARRGNKPFIAEESLGPQAVVIDNSLASGVPFIVDTFGTPLAFFRFPTDNADMNLSKPGAPNLDPRRDPQDPEGTLQDANWNSQANWNAGQATGQPGIYFFELLCHRVHDPTQPGWVMQAVYMQPTVVSSGVNRRLGILLVATPAFAGVTPNFGMFPDVTDPGGYNDDIFSYTLR
jgi:type II secretory pathway pseudopilin PulG